MIALSKSIALFFLVAFFMLNSEISHAQNVTGNHHLFFNYEWKVEHSRERWKVPTTPDKDCHRLECLNVGDSFSIGRNSDVRPGESVLFKINGNYNRPDYRFSVTTRTIEKSLCDNTKECITYFVGHFFDTAPGVENPPERTICISAVRYKNAYNDNPNDCKTRLRSLAENILIPTEIDTACANENLIYWDIAEGHYENCPDLTIKKDPEPGQGTASGKPPASGQP